MAALIRLETACMSKCLPGAATRCRVPATMPKMASPFSRAIFFINIFYVRDSLLYKAAPVVTEGCLFVVLRSPRKDASRRAKMTPPTVFLRILYKILRFFSILSRIHGNILFHYFAFWIHWNHYAPLCQNRIQHISVRIPVPVCS